MKQKERAVLEQLVEHKNTYVTSQDLASELSLSDRTVRSYIHRLKEVVEENGGTIEAKQGYGYQLKVLHKLAFDLFLSQSDISSPFEDQQLIISEVQDRQNYILNRLLLEDATLFLDDLAEELYISRSSLSKNILEIKELLKPYSLVIVSKPGQGMWIEGEERNKRHFIMDTFFGKNYANSLKKYLGNNVFFNDVSFEELTIIVLDEVREAKLKMSDFIIQNLVLHLLLGIKRLQEGFEIKDLGYSEDVFKGIEYQVAGKIMERIEIITSMSFPKEEIIYLALHLMAKANHDDDRENQELAAELNQVIEELSLLTGYSLSEDLQLRNGLLDHLQPMLVRLQRGILLENPLAKQIQSDYPQVFAWTKKAFSTMQSLQAYQVNEDEWAYLSLHVMAAVEKAKDACKVHALIICATGYGSSQLLKNRVVNEFGKHIVVTGVQGYYEINESSLEGVDVIISSIDLSTMVFRVPVLHVSVFLNDNDVNRVRKVINHFNPQRRGGIMEEDPYTIQKKKTYYMEQVPKEFFKVYATAPSKEVVLNDLIGLLSENEKENYSEKMLKQIQQRENMGQIIFSDTVAVPHPAMPIGVSTKIAVALIPSGMTWGGEENVQFVFLLSPSYIENEGITVVTKAIVRLVDLPEIQQAILQVPSFDNFNHQFLKII